MSCIKEFKDDKSDLTAICLNYPNTEEELLRFSENYYNAVISALEQQYGQNWGTKIKEKMLKTMEKKND